MKLTCVTATYNVVSAGNREKLIRCVRSVSKVQTSHEHLIYDGASTDGTVELLRELEDQTPGLRVTSEKDGGIYNALNKGVRDAGGDWFYVLGGDDYVHDPIVLDGLLEHADAGHEVIIAPVVRDVQNDGFYHDYKSLRNLLRYVTYCHQGMLVKTSTMKSIGGFDEDYRYASDWDMMLKLQLSGHRFDYTRKPFAFFASGGVSDSRRVESVKEAREIHKKYLALTEAEEVFFEKKATLPLHAILPFMIHQDGAIRMSARYCAFRWLLQVVKRMLGRA